MGSSIDGSFLVDRVRRPLKSWQTLCFDAFPHARRYFFTRPSQGRCWTCASEDTDHARALATLPAVLGGLGLESATRSAPAVYWAAWADSLPVFARCLADAEAARAPQQTEGWEPCPHWQAFQRPLTRKQVSVTGRVAGSSTRRVHATFSFATASCCQLCQPATARCSDRRRGRTQEHGSPIPSEAATTLSSDAMQLVSRWRLRMPLPIAGRISHNY